MTYPKHFDRSYLKTALLLFGITLLLSIPLHLKPDNFCVDDGYFYLQIARNIVQLHASTFNGWLPTNGYHPLWMIVCCICAWISTRSATLLQLAACVQDLFLGFSVAIVAFLTHRDRMRGVVFGCILLWLTNDVLGIWRLLETDLALLLQLALLLFVTARRLQRRPVDAKYSLALGCLLGLMLLARLDLVFFASVVLAYHLFGSLSQGTYLRRCSLFLIQSFTMVATMLPYLAWNVFKFHHLMPVSGAIKNFARHTPIHFHLLLALPTLPVLLGGIFGIAMLFRKGRSCFETALMLTGLGAFAHLTYITFFSMAWPWYFTTGYLAFSLGSIWIANVVLCALKARAWTEGAVLCAVVVSFLLIAGIRAETNLSFTRFFQTRRVQLGSTYTEPRRAFADLLRSRFAPGTRFFVFDSPGSVAYYSGMSVTPADGLVADYRYNDQVAKMGIASYAHEHGMNYFAFPILKPGQRYDWLWVRGEGIANAQKMEYSTPLGNRSGGSFLLQDEDIVLTARTIQPSFESAYPLVGVWKQQ